MSHPFDSLYDGLEHGKWTFLHSYTNHDNCAYQPISRFALCLRGSIGLSFAPVVLPFALRQVLVKG